MKVIVLKHDASKAQQDLPVGNAIISVLNNPYVEAIPGTLYAAIISDVVKYTLKISAIVVFWRMVVGQQAINISLITYLWLIAFVIDFLVKEISFVFAGIANISAKNDIFSNFPDLRKVAVKWNNFWRVANLLMSGLTSACTLCLFFVHTAILKSIVSHLNASTALFDLYYTTEQPFKIPALSVGYDIFLLTIIILFTGNGRLLDMVYWCSPCIFDRFISSKESLREEHKVPDTISDNALFSKRPTSTLYADFISFETLSFPIFLMVMRIKYSADNVEFLHQLLWNIPIFYYISTFIWGPGFSCLCLFLCCETRLKSKEKESLRLAPPLCIKFILLMVGAVMFKKHRESDPRWAIQIFLGTLIFEKVASLVIALGIAILSIKNEEGRIVLKRNAETAETRDVTEEV